MKPLEGNQTLVAAGNAGISLATAQEFAAERAIDKHLPVAPRDVVPYEISLSGSQVLVGLMVGLCLISLCVWTVVRYWLFAK